MSKPHPSTTCHVEEYRHSEGITAKCGYVIRWTKKNGAANATTGAAARKDRVHCPDCLFMVRLEAEFHAIEPIEATALLDEADNILGIDA